MYPGVTLGRCRDMDGVSLAEVDYAPGFTMGRHAHSDPYLTVTLAGEYSERFQPVSLKAGPVPLPSTRTCLEGSIVFRPAGEAHATRFHARPGRCLRVRLSPGWLAEGPPDLRLPQRSVQLHAGPLGSLAAQLHGELVAGRSRAAIQGLTRALVVGIARRAEAIAAGVPPWLPRVLDRMHAEFARPLPLADLARTAGVHPLHLARVFRRRHGTTVAAYVRRLRLESGLHQLRLPDRTLAEIALCAGFADQSHFTRTFKRMTGLTPRAYRRTLGSF
jgi:AraC family transcriptional regulator